MAILVKCGPSQLALLTMNALRLILVSVIINVSYCSAALTRSLLEKTTRSMRITNVPTRTYMSSKNWNDSDGVALLKLGLGLGICYYGLSSFSDHVSILKKAELDSRERKDLFFKCNVVPTTLGDSSIKNAEHVISDCFDAIRGDDHKNFEGKCIYSEFNVNCRDNDGVTALEVAIKAGKTEYIQKLIDNGAYITAFGSRGSYYLNCAMENDQPEAIKVLVANGADVNNSGVHNAAPHLAKAIESGNERIIRALIAAGADFNAKDSQGRKYLQTAIEKGDLKTIKILIGAGADLYDKDNLSRSYLLTAAVNNQKDAFDLLVARGLRIRIGKIHSIVAEIVKLGLKADPSHQDDYFEMIAKLFVMAYCDHGIYSHLKSLEYGKDNLDKLKQFKAYYCRISLN